MSDPGALLAAVSAPFFELRPLDLIDILLVAALLYGVTVWLRRSRGSTAAIGLFSLLLFYAVARAVGLQLVSRIFEAFFAFFALVFVVVFQDDLRQFFERVALWGIGRRRRSRARSGVSDTLTACLTSFARQRIGALIVIPGRQPVAPHVRGGIDLGGRVSLPLLESLFDPHSPGHDGALIIEGDRVMRFAVHLPLSENFAALEGAGTRHSAALGLSERCDALCLIASEERGQISVARNGELRRLQDPAEVAHLLAEIDAAQEEPAPRGLRFQAATTLRRIRWRDTLLSIAVALIVWLALVPGVRPAETSVTVPVTLAGLAPKFTLEKIDPPEVKVTLAAPARSFYFFNEASVQVVVDATLADVGRRTFSLDENEVRRPSGIEVVRIEPDRVKLSLLSEAKPTPAAPRN